MPQTICMMASVRSVIALGFAAAWLGGCAVGGFDLGSSSTPAAPPAAEPASAPAPAVATAQPIEPAAPPPAYAQTSRQLPAGRAVRAPAAPPPAPPPEAATEDEGPLTITKAREQCWMSTEGNKATKDLDAKSKFVAKCVDEKMKNAAR